MRKSPIFSWGHISASLLTLWFLLSPAGFVDAAPQATAASVSVGYGKMSGSLSASGSKVKSDFASVAEQSAIKAGDGGFQVDAKGNTDLKAGAITSTQAAIDADKNRFRTGGELSTSDLQNKAEYSAQSASVNIGTGFDAAGKLTPQGTSAGFGKDGGKAGSTTQAGISGVAGHQGARTGDAQTGIKPIFDQQQVQKEIDAQTKITQMFGQMASKAVGDYATTKLKEAGTLRDKASKEIDPGRAQQLKAQATEIENQWGDQGTLRLAAHTLIGGLTGGASGAAGAAAGTIAAPLVAKALADAGVDANLGKVITALASTAAGAAVGGASGAGAALNEVANNYLKHSEILEKETRKKQECAAGDSACRQKIETEYSRLSQERDRLHESCATAESCRAARAEIERDMAQLAARAKELEQLSWKGQITPVLLAEAVSISLNLNDAAASYDQTWRQSRSVIPFSEWTSQEKNKTFSDAMTALGGLGAAGAVGRGAGGVQSVAKPGVPSKSSADEFKLDPTKPVQTVKPDGKFETLGLQRDPMTFPDGVKMVNELEKSGLSRQEALDAATWYVKSGSTPPIAIPLDVTDKLVKVVPAGGQPSASTGYWMRESELPNLQKDPATMANKLGLPPGMQVDKFDVFQITPRSGAVVFESKIAPTTVNGVVDTTGGARQSIVVDRNQFTPPMKVGSIEVKKGN